MLRTAIFQIAYWACSIFFVLTALPLMLLPGRQAVVAWIRIYCRAMVAVMRWAGGIRVGVLGRENLPAGPFIIAAKHQSWGDGFVTFAAVPDLAFVTGDHLLRFPLVGPILRRMGAIVVDNCGGTVARGRLVAGEMAAARAQGRPILIYPEGHLAPVGQQYRYRRGVFHLYESYGCPVVPVATDLGVRWPQQSRATRPGPCSVHFLPAIPPGLDKETFMARLEATIETESRAMLRAQHVAGTLPAGIDPDPPRRVLDPPVLPTAKPARRNRPPAKGTI